MTNINLTEEELLTLQKCFKDDDATHREKYLKTYHGKTYIKKRLKSYLTGEIGFTAREKQKIKLYDRFGFHKSARHVLHERAQGQLVISKRKNRNQSPIVTGWQE